MRKNFRLKLSDTVSEYNKDFALANLSHHFTGYDPQFTDVGNGFITFAVNTDDYLTNKIIRDKLIHSSFVSSVSSGDPKKRVLRVPQLKEAHSNRVLPYPKNGLERHIELDHDKSMDEEKAYKDFEDMSDKKFKEIYGNMSILEAWHSQDHELYGGNGHDHNWDNGPNEIKEAHLKLPRESDTDKTLKHLIYNHGYNSENLQDDLQKFRDLQGQQTITLDHYLLFEHTLRHTVNQQENLEHGHYAHKILPSLEGQEGWGNLVRHLIHDHSYRSEQDLMDRHFQISDMIDPDENFSFIDYLNDVHSQEHAMGDSPSIVPHRHAHAERILPEIPQPIDPIERHIKIEHRVENPLQDMIEWQELEKHIKNLHDLHDWYHNKEYYGEETGPHHPGNTDEGEPLTIPHKHAHADRILPGIDNASEEDLIRHLVNEHKTLHQKTKDDIDELLNQMQGWQHWEYISKLRKVHEYEHNWDDFNSEKYPHSTPHKHASQYPDFAHGQGINGTQLTDTASNNPFTTQEGKSGVDSNLHIQENQDPQYIIAQDAITDPQRNRTFMSNWKNRYSEKKKDPITGFEINEEENENEGRSLTNLWGGIGGTGTSNDKSGNS